MMPENNQPVDYVAQLHNLLSGVLHEPAQVSVTEGNPEAHEENLYEVVGDSNGLIADTGTSRANAYLLAWLWNVAPDLLTELTRLRKIKQEAVRMAAEYKWDHHPGCECEYGRQCGCKTPDNLKRLYPAIAAEIPDA